ncbi:hypothetical protein DK853_42970, partial [Klebsiella oxytoca]
MAIKLVDFYSRIHPFHVFFHLRFIYKAGKDDLTQEIFYLFIVNHWLFPVGFLVFKGIQKNQITLYFS